MSKEQTGIAGEFWFFSQLQRLGYESYITLGNTKSIDIAVKLSDGTTLSFDVKSKINFGGSFQHLQNIPKKENHFAVFVDLAARIDNSSGRTTLITHPKCYILKSTDLDHIAFNWTSSKGTSKGYGFEAKLLWFLKRKEMMSITKKNIKDFKERHHVAEDIDHEFYQKVIWTLEDFENHYYRLK